ncbi:IS3 family transposase [Gemella morbillorum]|uniref:IS3 family transposase n=1 Tax=Gemella morbillorum TaxID=29391 RepID=UPI003F719574
MRYSYEFKIKCVEMYERGEYPSTHDGVTTNRFRNYIRIWKRMVDDSSGIASLRHKPQNKNWSPEEKLVLVSKVLAGDSYNCVVLDNGINSGMFSKAVDKYIYYYNNKRIRSKTKWMPPVQYRITSTYLN